MNAPHDEGPPPGKRPKVHTDETGHTVWDDTIKTARFELVSTQQLRQLLDAAEDAPRDEIRKLAAGDEEGYLARDAGTGMFRVIDDDDLQALLDTQDEDLPAIARPAPAQPAPAPKAGGNEDELSLVSTQRLRKLLDTPGGTAKPAAKKPRRDEGGGFNPYDSG